MATTPPDPLILEASLLIEQRIGLNLGKQFPDDLHGLLYELAGGDLRALVSQLRHQPETAPAWQTLMQALTIGETYFFRDTALFRWLRESILPDLIRHRRQQGHFELRIWSAGCATGEEPYSIAMVLHELLPDLADWRISLNATDINGRALEQARQGIYRDWAFRQVDQSLQSRYFDPVPGGWQIKPYIRERVSFDHGNLLARPFMPLDIIFCRNVLIYFAAPAASRMEDLLYAALQPGGWLVLGQPESPRHQRERWQVHTSGKTVLYRKPPAVIASARPPASVSSSSDEHPAYRAAVTAFHDERTAEAEAHLRALLAEQPGHAQAHVLLASILAGRRDLSAAHVQLDFALQRDSLLADAHYLRAVLFLEEEQHRLAQQALRSALYCQRDHLLAAFLLATLYARENDMARAVRVWEQAHAAAALMPPAAPISDLSDMTAASFMLLVESQLESLKYS
jgi:chemotaxis protein methyltransferase CheR